MHIIQIVLLVTLIGIVAFGAAVVHAARGDDDERRGGRRR